MRILLSLLVTLSLAVSASAQQAPSAPGASPSGPPPLPPGPLLKPAADNTRWTLTTTNKAVEPAKPAAGTPPPAEGTASPAPGAKPATKPKALMVGEKMGKLAHLLTVTVDGAKEEKWTDGILTATLSPGAKEPVYTTTRIEAMPLPSWINRKNYADTKIEGERSYLIFKDRIVPVGTEIVTDLENPTQADLDRFKVDATAVIDASTRLPIAVKEGEATTTYKFEPIAPGTEIVPDAIRKTMSERWKKFQDSLRKPVKP